MNLNEGLSNYRLTYFFMRSNFNLFHIVLTFVLLTNFSFSQNSFNKVFSTPTDALRTKDITQFGDSTFIVLSQRNNGHSLSKFTKTGVQIWNKNLTNTNFNEVHRMKLTSTNRIVVCGTAATSGTFGIVHYDTSGVILSSKTINYNLQGWGISISEIIEDVAGNLYFVSGDNIIKTTGTGNLIWNRAYKKYGLLFTSIVEINNEKLIVSGAALNVHGINSADDIVQMCINPQGEVLWSKSFGEVSVSENIVQSFYVDNKIYLFGNDQIISGEQKNSVLCTDTSGNVLLYKNYAKGINGIDVAFLKDSTFMITGIDDTIHKLFNVNKNGDIVSHQRFNFNFVSPAFSVPFIETLDGATLMAVSNLTPGSFNITKFRLNGDDSCLSRTHLAPQFSNQKNILSYDVLITGSNQIATFNDITYPLSLFALIPGFSCASNCPTVGKINSVVHRICEGTSINFSNASLNATGFLWTVNGSDTITTPTMNFTFASPGLFAITLISQGISCADTSRMSIVVTPNLVPTTFTHESDQRSITVTSSVNPDASLRWNFNDSPQEWFVSPMVHKYESLGSKEICLTQENTCGSQTHCDTINLMIDSTYSFLKHYDELGPPYVGRRYPQWSETLADGGTIVGVVDDVYGSAGLKGSLLKVDKKGNHAWTQVQNIGGENYRVKEITELMDGQLVMVGTNGSTIHYCRLNENGEYSFFKVMNGTVANARVCKPYELANGNIAFTGSYSNKSFLMITDKTMDVFFTKIISGISSLRHTIKVDDGLILIGSHNFQTRVMKIDFEGNILYSKRIDLLGYTNEQPWDAKLTLNNDLMLLGSANPSSGAPRTFIIKMDINFNIQWTKTFPDVALSFELDPAGNIFVAHDANLNGKLSKFDANGNHLWKWQYSNPMMASNRLSAIHVNKTNEGGLMIPIISRGFAAANYLDEVSLMKFDATNTPPTCEGFTVPVVVQNDNALIYNEIDSVNSDYKTFTVAITNDSFDANIITSCSTTEPLFSCQYSLIGACQDSAFQFQDISNSTLPYTRAWTFQNGIPAASSAANPTVIWNTVGTYIATLTITSSSGSSTFTQQISVAPTPSAVAGMDLISCQNNGSLSLSGSGVGTLVWMSNPLITNINNVNSTINPVNNSQFILKASSGHCSAHDTVQLTVLPTSLETTNVTLCEGDSILFRGNYYSAAGDHPVTFTNSYGCDSSFLLHISNFPALSSTDTHVSCESFTWIDNVEYTSSNTTATYTMQSVNGCDSIVHLNLTINYNDLNGMQEELRCGEFTWIDGITYTSSTIETYALPTTHGCDSLVTLDLTIIPNSHVFYTETACDYFNWINGHTYTSDTIVSFVQEPNAAGCDSIAHLTLTIIPSSQTSQTVFACGTFNWIDGVTYTESTNTEFFTLQSSTGCDSTVYLDLTINELETNIETIEACGSYTWTNGITYTSSNSSATHVIIGGAQNGCDLIQQLDLTINDNETIIETIAACDSFTWTDGITYTSSNSTASQTISGGAQNGCDLIQQLNLTITPTPIATVSNASPGFISSNPASSYQWVNCLNNQVINGATAQTFQPMSNGSYAVIQTNAGGCIDTSDCFIFNYIGFNEQSANNEIRLYPNPTKAMIRIDLGNATNGVATLKELNGKVIVSKNIHSGEEMNIGDLAAGTYLISVSCNEVVNVFRVVKE